jgi:hypothetical protein
MASASNFFRPEYLILTRHCVSAWLPIDNERRLARTHNNKKKEALPEENPQAKPDIPR